jgi:cell division initiation protein
MDVSPKTLREVEFREKMRGYHPEDVDQFLERVAAGIEVLQDRLRQAIERAQRAEQAATEAGGNDDALRRTLLLAQRTADLAVQEGREQAARIVATAEQQFQAKLSEAEQRAQTMITEAETRTQTALADAERRASSMVSEAEQNARRGHEDALIEVRAELARLEVTRQRVQADIDAMTRWVGEHRHTLRSALEEALARVEQINIAPPPVPSAPYSPDDRPPAAAATEAIPRPAADPNVTWAPQSSAPTVAAPAASVPAESAPPASAPATSSPPAEASPHPQPETVAWAPQAPESAAEEGSDADPYFAELRRAISDRDPLGPAEEDARPGGGHSDS